MFLKLILTMFLICFVLSYFVSTVFAQLDNSYEKAYLMDITKAKMLCMRDHTVDISEIHNLGKGITPTKRETKCLLACAYKREGTMTKEGLYNEKHMLDMPNILRQKGTPREEKQRKYQAKRMAAVCSKVNSYQVSDGEKGCDRAAYIFDCVKKLARKLNMMVS